MNRLIDRLPFFKQQEIQAVFIIDNVADYFFSAEKYNDLESKESWGYKDFPNIAPPFHSYWMEYKIPNQPDKNIRHGVQFLEQRLFLWREQWADFDKDAQNKGLSIALDLIEKYQAKNQKYSVGMCAFGVLSFIYFHTLVEKKKRKDVYIPVLPMKAIAQFLPDIHWVIIVFPFMGGAGKPISPGDILLLGLDKKGVPVANNKEVFSVTIRDAPSDLNIEKGMLRDIGDWQLMHWFFPSLLATSFLHCKNIQTREHVPNKKESAHHRRLHGMPLAKYYTLEIDPMKKILQSEGNIEANGLKKALHICRGHFAEYGPDFGKGKLFGKHEGRFWIPQHMKGSSEQGIIHKDYSVNAPEVAAT